MFALHKQGLLFRFLCFGKGAAKHRAQGRVVQDTEAELFAATSSFSQLAFHQQNPMIAGQRPEKRSRRAPCAQADAATLGW
jgi:hypothetical protein